METFWIKPKLYFGPEPMAALDQLAGKRVLIVTDAFLASSGLLDRVKNRLTGAVEIFDQVEPDPSLRLVAQGVRMLRDFGPDAVVAFGGGSPMDCAKGMCWFSDRHPPLWCIPTTAGTGSEVTSFAVLTDTDQGVKYPLVEEDLLPEAAILDASLLEGVPPHVTADTGMDVLTHASEAYVARKANAFTDALAEQAFVLAWENLIKAHAAKGEHPAKEQMLLASCMAGIAFNGAGLGANHALAHSLGGRYHTPHGRLNAMLMPHVIRFNAEEPAAAKKYAALAKACGLAPNARALSSALGRLRQSLGMPGRLTDCGVERKTVLADLEAITAAALADVCMPGNPRSAAAAELAAIVREVL